MKLGLVPRVTGNKQGPPRSWRQVPVVNRAFGFGLQLEAGAARKLLKVGPISAADVIKGKRPATPR
jgi:hypothetical protein